MKTAVQALVMVLCGFGMLMASEFVKKEYKETIIAIVLDESGSMNEGDKKQKTISGFNEYFESVTSRKEKPKFELTRFNTEKMEVGLEGLKLTAENYQPNAGTPLYDAIGKTIENVDKSFCRHTKILLVIFTDGLENSSTKFSQSQIRSMISEREEKGWTIVYMGSDKGTYLSANDIGISPLNIIRFGDHQFDIGIRALTVETGAMLNGTKVNTTGFFTSEESIKLKEENK